MSAWIALLRGINVGGAHRVAMADLRDLFAGLGFGDAQTLIQSGNVAVPGLPPGDIEDRLELAFLERFGFASAFVVRTSDELEKVIAGNPFPVEAADNPNRLMIHFFKSAPAQGAEPKGAVHERVHLAGSAAYVYYPVGIGESKLKLPEVSTARNWNTVLKLAAMADSI